MLDLVKDRLVEIKTEANALKDYIGGRIWCAMQVLLLMKIQRAPWRSSLG